MREIKFRGQSKDTGEFAHGHYANDGSDAMILRNEDFRAIFIDRETLGQYTGLKDKNGFTDIYEDDIINSEGLVIGNKYQNYELLKEPTNFLIQGFGTEDWETTNKKAMERGCKYSKRYADKNEF